jgi:hypothetical protein
VSKTATVEAELGQMIDKINALIIQLQQTLARRGAGGKVERPGGTPTMPDDGDDDETPDPTLPGGGGGDFGEAPDPFL